MEGVADCVAVDVDVDKELVLVDVAVGVAVDVADVEEGDDTIVKESLANSGLVSPGL